MRRVILLTGLALAVGVFLPGSALPAMGGSDLPFTASQSGTSTTNLVTGQAHLLTTGPVNHFGLAAFEQDLQLVPTGPVTFSYSGTWTLTAANGDQMFGTSSGSGSFTDALHSTWVGNYTSNGGTGRFADAGLTFLGTAHLLRVSLVGAISTSSVEGTASGQLSY